MNRKQAFLPNITTSAINNNAGDLVIRRTDRIAIAVNNFSSFNGSLLFFTKNIA